MPLPTSFLQTGFIPAEMARVSVSKSGRKLKRLMIGTDGPADSGKTEFALSAPGPGMLIALDRGFDKAIDNPKPPLARRNDYGVKVIKVPKETQFAKASDYLEYWKEFHKAYIAAVDNPDARTVVIDGDSDSWELQILSEFGRTMSINPLDRKGPNAARRAFYARAYDSGKIIIATNKTKSLYVDVLDDQGKQVMDYQGKPKQVKTEEYERQGFPDQNYLFNIQLRHMYRPPWTNAKTGKESPGQFGIKILKCGSNMELVGSELWGDQCNFRGLVEYVYPNVPMTSWGYEE